MTRCRCLTGTDFILQRCSEVSRKYESRYNIRCPDKPLYGKAFRASFTVSAAGYIRAADAALARNLPLGAGRPVIQTIAHGDNHPFPGGETGLDTPSHLYTGIPGVQVLQHMVVHRDHIHQGQRPPIPRRLQRIGQRDLTLELPLRTEIHQYLICYPHTVARQDRPNHRQAAAGDRYRPHRGHCRQRGKYVPSPRPRRCP